MKPLLVNEEIEKFLEVWNSDQQVKFLRDVGPLLELYDVEPDNDWVKNENNLDDETLRIIRLVRTVYLLSRIADFHADKLVRINFEFKNLWKKMEKQGVLCGE